MRMKRRMTGGGKSANSFVCRSKGTYRREKRGGRFLRGSVVVGNMGVKDVTLTIGHLSSHDYYGKKRTRGGEQNTTALTSLKFKLWGTGRCPKRKGKGIPFAERSCSKGGGFPIY